MFKSESLDGTLTKLFGGSGSWELPYNSLCVLGARPEKTTKIRTRTISTKIQRTNEGTGKNGGRSGDTGKEK